MMLLVKKDAMNFKCSKEKITPFLARLDKVQEELLYYTGVCVGVGVGIGGGRVSKMLKFLRLSFLCDGQGAVRQAILSL